MKREMRADRSLFLLTASAVMIALSVILCRYLGFSPENTPFRFEIGFLPIAVIAYLFGPVFSGVSYLIADIIGSVLSGYMPNPWLSLAQLLFGITLGVFFHKKRPTLLRATLVFTLIATVIDTLIKAPMFVFLYGYTYDFAFMTRAINAAVNLPLRIFTYYLFMRALEKPFLKISHRFALFEKENATITRGEENDNG